MTVPATRWRQVNWRPYRDLKLLHVLHGMWRALNEPHLVSCERLPTSVASGFATRVGGSAGAVAPAESEEHRK